MGSDGENNFRDIFKQNLSNGPRSVTRNVLLRSLVSQQKTGTVEKVGEFDALVYRLNKPALGSDENNQNSVCNDCAALHPTSSLSSKLTTRSQAQPLLMKRGTTQSDESDKVSAPSNLLLSNTPITTINFNNNDADTTDIVAGTNKNNDVSVSIKDLKDESAHSNHTAHSGASTYDKSVSTVSLSKKKRKKKREPNSPAGDPKEDENDDDGRLDSISHNSDNNSASVSKSLRSTVFMVDDCNHIYRLAFHATNANIIPLAFNDSVKPIPGNEKCTQAYSSDHYAMKFFKKHTRELNYVHYYELCYTDGKEPKREKTLMPKRTVDVVKKGNEKIASPQKSPAISSTIYVDFEKFRLCLHPTTLIRIDRVSTAHKPKKANEDGECQGQNAQQDDSAVVGASPYQLDTASLTIFQNNDIYSVVFTLTDCVLERIVPIHQLGTTTPLPDLVYCRISSLTSQKKKFIYAPIPRTTYFYENPLPKIVFKNRFNRFYGLPPEWKSQKIQEKAKQEKINRYNTMLNNANKMGNSRIYFGANNICIRAKSKAMKMLVDDGEEFYDDWSIKEKIRYNQVDNKGSHAPNVVCRFCSQLVQGDSKSPDSIETKEEVEEND